jgi:hypothetical protein
MSQEIDDMFSSDLKDLANPSRVKLAEAEKTALVGPLLELGNLGIPSGIGYAVGANKTPVSKDEARRQLDSGYSVGKGLLVPGYTGYRAGKNSAAREMLRAAESKKKKGKKEAALSPEMAFNAGRVKGAQDPSRPGAEMPENLKAVERMRPNKQSPLTDKIEAAKKQASWQQPAGRRDTLGRGSRTGDLGKTIGKLMKTTRSKEASADDLFAAELCQAVGLDVPEAYVDFQRPQVKIAGSASDAIDNHFRGWMEKKAGEDVVKVASDDEDKDEESECSMDHSKLKTGTKCKKCGEMCKESSVKEALSRGFIEAMLKGKKIVGKGGRTASQRLMRASDRGQSAFSRRVGADAPKRMTNSALELQSQADGQLNNIGRDIAAGTSKTSSVKTAMCGAEHKKLKPGAKCEKCGEMAKTAGIIEHDENLDLLAKIRARAAQGLGLNGDG